MTEAKMSSPIPHTLSNLWRLRALLILSLIWIAPSLACGSFAPRPTPTPTLPPQIGSTTPMSSGEPQVTTVPTQALVIVTETPTVSPTATQAPTPQPGTALAAGQPARVTAPAGLNFRDAPNPNATLLGQLGTGVLVKIVDGPQQAGNFTWWKVDDGKGNVGWAADGDGETKWLSPQVGESQPVNRAPRVGDRVVVTMPAGGQLTVRARPGTEASVVTRVNPGQQFTVLAGPESANGYTWFQIRSDDGSIQGWVADSDGTTRWLSPLE